jgi:hypothetical protein
VILTDDGKKWATEREGENIVATVALTGYGSTWPAAHVDAAIAACNTAAENEKKKEHA